MFGYKRTKPRFLAQALSTGNHSLSFVSFFIEVFHVLFVSRDSPSVFGAVFFRFYRIFFGVFIVFLFARSGIGSRRTNRAVVPTAVVSVEVGSCGYRRKRFYDDGDKRGGQTDDGSVGVDGEGFVAFVGQRTDMAIARSGRGEFDGFVPFGR